MLLRGTGVLNAAYRGQRAIAALVAYNLETVQAIVGAAEDTGQPVLVIAGSAAFRHAGRRALALIALEAAKASPAAIGVHLDHSRSLEEIAECLALGYTSVMVDGSHLPFEENVAFTRAAVDLAHRAGAWVEAELVGIAGEEDRSTNAVSSGMTDPELAAEFVRVTKVDALAVAVGNVHGFTRQPPPIDLARLGAVRRVVAVPLVLHGASGLPDDVLVGCLERGVAKVNVNAELRRAFLTALADGLDAASTPADLAGLLAGARAAVRSRAAAVVNALARSGSRGVGEETTRTT